MMRIITGTARGVRLAAPEGDTTRPTAERAKEAVFSMLGTDLSGLCVLDLFAGSGQMGLEALSRGAAHATFADRDRAALRAIRENIVRTRMGEKATVFEGEALAFLRGTVSAARFDLVFLDPPYAAGLMPQCLAELADRHLLGAGARVVCETASPDDLFVGDGTLAAKYEVLRERRYGAAFVTVLAIKEETV